METLAPDDVRTDLVKFKAGHQHTPNWESRWTVAYENREDQGRNARNYLRDDAGQVIWGTATTARPTRCSTARPSTCETTSSAIASASGNRCSPLGTCRDGSATTGLTEATVSRFSVLADESSRIDASIPPDPLNDGSGTLTVFDHTGWTTVDVKLRDPDFLASPTLMFVTGYHYSRQRIGLTQYASNDWLTQTRDRQTNTKWRPDVHPGGPSAQLGWRAHPDWELTDRRTSGALAIAGRVRQQQQRRPHPP